MYIKKLTDWMNERNIKADILTFTQSTHTVKEAAEAVNAKETDLVKNICLVNDDDQLIVAIVKGEDRVSTKKIGKVLNCDRPRIANESEILSKTGYAIGGVPSFGYDAIFLVDEKVMENDIIYTGGGTSKSLIRITPSELLKWNNGKLVKIRKK